MALTDGKLELAESVVASVDTDKATGTTIATMQNGDMTPCPKSTKVGQRMRYARSKNPQVGRRGGDDVAEGWSFDPQAGQDLQLPIGRNAAPAAAFDLSDSSRTPKLLRRLTVVPDGGTPGFISECRAVGTTLFANARPAGGHRFPLVAFDPTRYAVKDFNDADLLTPAAVNVNVQGGFLNAQNDQVIASWTTDLVPKARLARYEASNKQNMGGIGNINWLFALSEAPAVGAGAAFTLEGIVARKPVTLGQLIIQASDPVGNTLIEDNVGISIDSIEVAGYPIFSADGVVPASLFSANNTDLRGAYIGKVIADAGQRVVVTGTNNTGAAVDILGGIFCE